jgi:hypothetical protein
MPDWYPLIRNARYLGCKPWELAEQPICWQVWATIADGAEAEARESRSNQDKPAQPGG